MEHARTGPSTGSSPLVARTTLLVLHLPRCDSLLPTAFCQLPAHLQHLTACWHVAPRALQPFLSGSRGRSVGRLGLAPLEKLSPAGILPLVSAVLCCLHPLASLGK